MAKTKIMPTSICGARISCTCTGSPPTSKAGNMLPKGITANGRIAATRIEIGASVYRNLSTWAGVYSSLKMNFKPSASGCPRPNILILVTECRRD